MKLCKYTRCLFMLLVCLSSKSAYTHKLDAAETSIKFNPRSEQFEIVHKFYLHDVNHLIQQHSRKSSKIDDTKKEQIFIDYILQNFSLSFISLPTPVTYLNSEKEGKYFYIYQEAAVKSLNEIKGVLVDITGMRSSWKPSHWLFLVELSKAKRDSFFLNKNTLTHTSVR